MNWLARLKKTETGPESDATKPTKRVSVVSVASIPAPIQKSEGDAVNKLGQVTCWNAGPANDAPDPNRDCWPHSSAWNTAEMETFKARLSRFTDKGLSLDDAEALAETLVQRDRDGDDRRPCLECVHLGGYAQVAWGCQNWLMPNSETRAKGIKLSGEWVNVLRRCDGFKGVETS